MDGRALQASVASDGMEISINLPHGSPMEKRLRYEAARLKTEPGFLLIDIVEAALGKQVDNDLIGPLIAAHFIQLAKPNIKRSDVFQQIADACKKRGK